MKHIFMITTALFGFFQNAYSQPAYTYKEPLIRIDFGSGEQVADFNAVKPALYERVSKYCPDDGCYAYANFTRNCFNDDWFIIKSDHTGNAGGNMMLVNAVETGGIYFTAILKGLTPGATYEFSAWLMNVCRINGGCDPLPPNIETSLRTFTGQLAARFKTGRLLQTNTPSWRRYSAVFTVPAGETDLALVMSNLTTGGCGNDFAMDDLEVRERVEPQKDATVRLVLKPTPGPQRVVVKKPAEMPQPEKPAVKKAEKATILKEEAEKLVTTTPIEKPAVTTPIIKKQVFKPAPPLLLQRENPVVKTVTTGAGEMLIDLYDNGQVDGDTVTIYHNNELVVSGARLSEKPVSFNLSVDSDHPHHEIVMVANNLGSIPPNTSLMIIRINGLRYDVFISSSEQKNAKVVIDLDR